MPDASFFIECWRAEHDGQDPEWHWEICSTCHGHGTSTAYLGAYTQSDREEMGDEWWDFIEDVQRGVYDKACPECSGSGKVKEFSGEALALWHEWCVEEAQDRHTRWAEDGYPQ